MNHAIILAGGTGSRMGLNIPKQYIEVNGKPIILYSYLKFSECTKINSIVFVISPQWEEYMRDIIRDNPFNGQIIFSKAGTSRQDSVLNGLKAIRAFACAQDIVFIHDAVRPLFSISIVDAAINACKIYDGALPVISVKDATYRSSDRETLSSILPRDELFSGQSPECFRYGRILEAHSLFSDDEISSIRGTTELAYKAGLSIKLIPGSEQNFKITTIEDLYLYKQLLHDKD